MSYPIPESPVETLLEIKKSKFIAYASHVPDRESAMQVLAGVKSTYPDARHHCWAYLLGNPYSPASAAMSDDGEPSGTAGKPILNVLQHKQVGDIMLIVTRYFGGIKLGAGGLVRAYSGAAQQAMEHLPVKTRVALNKVAVEVDFRHEQYLRHWVSEHEGQVTNCQYQQAVTLTLALPASALNELEAVCASLGAQISKEGS
ncbi:YigZ family protein [Alteromonas aestuariivivens]|uniref:YigZ family protein n=1 Tax=Alteromonas aestuariivivens TaxID=1938339 RepID=A0A3D8MD78_9ALTE|nr:YigZ family protein [Alteromonas aestuariivivens]RDV28190.1 YigZ family protein [Alteromonas aestuariivivens]